MAKELLSGSGMARRTFRRTRKRTRHPGWGEILSQPAAGRVLFCLLIVGAHTFLFCRQQQLSFLLLLLVLLPGLVFGFLWHLLKGPEHRLGRWLSRRLGRVFAGFCLFFLYSVFYIALFSLVFSYPVGLLIGAFGGPMDLVRGYMLSSVNSVLVLAAFSWLHWWWSSRRPQHGIRRGKSLDMD